MNGVLRSDDSPAVIIVRNFGVCSDYVIGPFETGTAASRYGFARLKDADWWWLPLNAPQPADEEV
jgi:hypothetical protein